MIPLATFTTLAVLGAGSGDPPEWMAENLELQETKEQNLVNSVNNLANTIIAPEVTETVAKFVPLPVDSMNSDTGHDSGEQNVTQHPAFETNSKSELAVEEPDEFGFEHFFDGDFGQQETKPSHDEPVVRGFK